MAAPTPYGRQLERSILDMVQEQSHRLQAMSDELDTVRAALNERKLVERAKGLLMAHRRLSEEEAHKMLRQTAMSQNRRLVDVAESVLAMAEYLPGRSPLHGRAAPELVHRTTIVPSAACADDRRSEPAGTDVDCYRFDSRQQLASAGTQLAIT